MADLGYKSWIGDEEYVNFDPRSPDASSAEEREAARIFWDSIQLQTCKETGGDVVKRRRPKKKKPVITDPSEEEETAEEKEKRRRNQICKELLHHTVPDWVLDAMVPQLEKIYEETKLAKRNLRKEKKEKAKIEPEEGFFPTEQRRPNIGICQVCPVIGPKTSFPILTFDNMGRPNGKNIEGKSENSPNPSKTGGRPIGSGAKYRSVGKCETDAKSGNKAKTVKSPVDAGYHWWREPKLVAPEEMDYDNEGDGARMEGKTEKDQIITLPPCMTRDFYGKPTCDNIKERRQDY